MPIVNFHKRRIFVNIIEISFEHLIEDNIECSNNSTDKAIIRINITNHAFSVGIDKIEMEYYLDTKEASICSGKFKTECTPSNYQLGDTFPSTPISFWAGVRKSFFFRICLPDNSSIENINVNAIFKIYFSSRDNTTPLKPKVIQNNIYLERS